MKWEVETWRKLYVRVDAKWLSLPVSARGLGSELLKYADDEGRLHLDGDDPGLAVAYLLSAKPDEHKRIAKDFGLLVSVRHEFLVLTEPGVYQIRNFVSAQGKTSSAVRMARLRAKQNQRHSDANSDATVTRTVRERSDTPVTEQSDVFRDETRRDETSPERAGDQPQTDHSDHTRIRIAYAEAVSQATATLYPGIPPFAEEGAALENLWRFEQAKGAPLEEFLKFLTVSVAMWVSETRAKKETRFTGGWKPSKFVAWLIDRDANEKPATGQPDPSTRLVVAGPPPTAEQRAEHAANMAKLSEVLSGALSGPVKRPTRTA